MGSDLCPDTNSDENCWLNMPSKLSEVRNEVYMFIKFACGASV